MLQWKETESLIAFQCRSNFWIVGVICLASDSDVLPLIVPSTTEPGKEHISKKIGPRRKASDVLPSPSSLSQFQNSRWSFNSKGLVVIGIAPKWRSVKFPTAVERYKLSNYMVTTRITPTKYAKR